MDNSHHRPGARLLILLWLGGAVCTLFPSSAEAVACRDIATVQQSAVATQNTAMGGHLTQHIYGMTPPPGTSQNGKTLFRDSGKYAAVWRQYQYINNPVNCSGGQAQQVVSLNDLGIRYLDAYSCTAANAQGECTSWDSYMAHSVFFGFILKGGRWILNTAFPQPVTDRRSSQEDEGDRNRVSGIVVYEMGERGIRGRWTVNSPQYVGKTGTEVATGGQPGVWEGKYDVEIFDPLGKLIYRGQLIIDQVGATYQLRWRGADGNYDGLGLIAAERTLAASYWNVQ